MNNKQNNTTKTLRCLECKNDIVLPVKDIKPEFFFECPFCGITMEIKEIQEDGTVNYTIIEIEK